MLNTCISRYATAQLGYFMLSLVFKQSYLINMSSILLLLLLLWLLLLFFTINFIHSINLQQLQKAMAISKEAAAF